MGRERQDENEFAEIHQHIGKPQCNLSKETMATLRENPAKS